MARPRSHALSLILAVAWTLAILALCSIPGDELPQVRLISADKIGHFTIFAGFGWLWMRSLRMNVRSRFRWVVAAGLSYAVLTEIYQGIVPIGREPDAWDAVANSAGLLAGAGLWRLSSILGYRVRNPRGTAE